MDLIQVVKQLVGMAATPLACAFLITLLGIIVWISRLRRLAAGMWISAACLIYLAAVAPVATALLAPLETRYPPLIDVQSIPQVRYIVVLGSPYEPRDGIPVTAALGSEGLMRITEGVRLMRQLHGVHLVVSGGAVENQTPSAIGYAKLAIDLGVNPDDIVMLDTPLDTQEEASGIAALLGKSPFILVTSAYHMPRAMRLMLAAGAQPVPAPTGQLTTAKRSFGLRAWIPNSASLYRTERATHEFIGLAFAN